ncbi:SET domain-containing protein SmydA-8 isoform X2 [Anabrus simplex]|uniref:SET domain-containing protein SmydA-8 isoform X2 n=1 Tax=Anabrus simplex TaxID=316456 RepID=UPI0035A322EB
MSAPTSGTCAVCQSPATQCCSGCRCVFYCGRDHQRQHWKMHKSQCQMYKIATDETLGRYLVATRDIKQGEMIFQETPIVTGPKVVTYPVCLGCLHQMKPESEWRACSGCSWPMCSTKCELSPQHLSECKLMQEKGFRASIDVQKKKESAYCSIVPLRCLLLKDKSPEKYKTLMSLQSHLEERRNTTLYTIFRTNVVGFIRTALGMEHVDEETILKIAAILDTNSFEVRYKEMKGRAVYPTAAMMSHNCKPNTKHIISSPDFTLQVIATVPIKRGEIISVTYTQTLWGTLARRAHLKMSKCFDCHCERCSDPTELETYLGAILCSRCKRKKADCKIISTDPLDPAAPWKCQACDHTIPGRQIAWGNDSIRQEIEALDKTKMEALENFLEKYSNALHPTNSHVVEVKYALTQGYGNLVGYTLPELTDKQLARRIDLCHELLELADILDPGASRLRGSLLFDLQATMVVKAKKDFQEEKITKSAAEDILGRAMIFLQEAAEIFRQEPEMVEKLQDMLENLSKELE